MATPREVDILFLDVDGILTDNRVFVGADGSHLKAFNVADGLGIKIAQRGGLVVAIISGHASPCTEQRFRRLGVEEIHLGILNKRQVFEEVLRRQGFAARHAGAMGDDLLDLPLLDAAGFVATVPEAHAQVLRRADYVTHRSGGQGAVREVIELILKAKGQLAELFKTFEK